MGINDAFSNALSGARSTATSTLRAAQAQALALQQQTMTALSGAQQAVQRAIAPVQETRSTAPAPRTAKTLLPTDLDGGGSAQRSSPFESASRSTAQVASSGAQNVSLGGTGPLQTQIQTRAPPLSPAASPFESASRSTAQVARSGAQNVSPGGTGPLQTQIQTRAPSPSPAPAPTPSRSPVAPTPGRSVGGAGPLQQQIKARAGTPSPTLAASPTTRPSASPFDAASRSTTQVARTVSLSPFDRQQQFVRDIERFNANPDLARLPGLVEQYEQKSAAYQIDPDLRKFEQKLALYNAHLAAHERAVALGQGRQETADRLNLTRQELVSWGNRIDARHQQEYGELQNLASTIRGISTPIQHEYQRLMVEEQALARGRSDARSQQPSPMRSAYGQFATAHAPIIQGLERDIGRVVAPVRPYIDFANQRKAEAQAELTRRAGPAASFEEGWTYPLYQAGQAINVEYQRVVEATEPIWSFTNPLRSIPEARALQGGFARAPGKYVEDITWLAPAAERIGQLTWKEPHKLPATVSRFAGDQFAGISDAWDRDPWGTVGEVAGELAISFGVGGLAKRIAAPSTVGKGGGSAPPPPRPGAGHRFRGIEFGYQTKLIPKPPTVEKPFSVADWHAERAKYARSGAATQLATRRARQASILPSPSPAPAQVARLAYGAPYVMADPRGSISSPAPVVAAPQQTMTALSGAQNVSSLGVKQASVKQVGASALVTQAVEKQDEDSILAMIIAAPKLDLMAPLALKTVTVHEETLLTVAPPRRRVAAPPLQVLPPLRSPPRRRERKKDPEEERRMRKKKGEADHWEIGPAPGTEEMAGMIFGPGSTSARGSYLDFGPPSIGVGGTAPDRNRNKPAHAGKKMPKKGTPRKMKTKK